MMISKTCMPSLLMMAITLVLVGCGGGGSDGSSSQNSTANGSGSGSDSSNDGGTIPQPVGCTVEQYRDNHICVNKTK